MVGDASIPLIPRKTFFGNANALSPQLSPDGRWLAWIAPADDVMNVWVAPRDDVTKARPLTRQTDRPIFDALVRAHECACAVQQRQGRRRELQPLVRRP